MCFSEFTGYTCGHTSVEVIRACPLTTNGHKFPLCSVYARRPILVPSMCPTCSRIIHGRGVLIMEWEHRWAHERGICGCRVIFPHMMGPRVVRPSGGDDGDDGRNGGRGGLGGPCDAAGAYDGSGDSRQQATGSDGDGQSNMPAIYEESRSGHGTQFNVRLTSMYGVEWVQEHKILHDKGECHCPGMFELYKGPWQYEMRQEDYEQLARGGNGTELDAYIARMAGGSQSEYAVTETESEASPDFILSYGTPVAAQHRLAASTTGPAHSASSSPAPSQQIASGNDQTSSSWHGTPPEPFATHTPPLRASRGPGAIHDTRSASAAALGPSSNHLFNEACAAGSRPTYANFTSVDYPKDVNRKILVGLPIGAGPEGIIHMPKWEDCVMRTRGMRAESH